VACQQTPGASGGANEVGHRSSSPAAGRLRSRVGLVGACGWGSGMPAPSGQIPPPGARWENEAPTTRAARRPVPGHSQSSRRKRARPASLRRSPSDQFIARRGPLRRAQWAKRGGRTILGLRSSARARPPPSVAGCGVRRGRGRGTGRGLVQRAADAVVGISANGMSRAEPRMRTRCHELASTASLAQVPSWARWPSHRMSASRTRGADASAAAPLTHNAAGVTRAATASAAHSRARGQVPESVR
jgi:hypothetical protein